MFSLKSDAFLRKKSPDITQKISEPKQPMDDRTTWPKSPWMVLSTYKERRKSIGPISHSCANLQKSEGQALHVASAPTDTTTLTMGGPRAPPSGASACPNPRSPECRVALGRLSRFPPCSPCPSSSSATSPKVRTRVRTHSVGQQTPRAHLAERKLPRIGVASRPLRPTAMPYALRAHAASRSCSVDYSRSDRRSAPELLRVFTAAMDQVWTTTIYNQQQHVSRPQHSSQIAQKHSAALLVQQSLQVPWCMLQGSQEMHKRQGLRCLMTHRHAGAGTRKSPVAYTFLKASALNDAAVLCSFACCICLTASQCLQVCAALHCCAMAFAALHLPKCLL